jgi:hypothetical protein
MNTKPKTKSKPATAEPLEIAPNQSAASASWDVPLAVLKAAKSQGCKAFSPGGRINRQEFFSWLKTHEADADQAVALDLEKAERAELELQKLRAQIRLLRSRNERETRETIPIAEACAEWGRAVAIAQEECQILMDDRDRYRVFCERWKSRVGSMFQLTPQEMIATIEKFYTPSPAVK